MTPTHHAALAAAPPDLAVRLPEFHIALEQQRQFRLAQLRELAAATTNSSPTVDDVHVQVGEILRTSAATALTEVEDALDRLRIGRFGICERCTLRISYERLEILPMSRYCMRCQHDLEMRSD